MRRLGFTKVHTSQGNGWLIDKDRLTYLEQIYFRDTLSLEKVQAVQKVQQEPFFRSCVICHKPIWTDDWIPVGGKPTHKECARRVRAGLKDENEVDQ
jgi:hypothetical protein